MRANHHQFVAFAYVVREGTFSAAARRLNVTQSTITQHVAKLEKSVGAELVLRRRDGVELTATGREFFDLADRLFALDTEISERLAGFANMKEGRLKVIANAPQPALRIIDTFNKRFPDIHIDFRLFDWTTATAMIRDRLADVGLITDAPVRDDWERLPLEETRYTLYCQSSSALAARRFLRLADLQHETVILPEHGSLTQRLVNERLKELGLSLPRLVTMTTFPVMCEAVRQGLGVAIFLSNSSLIQDGLAEVEIQDFNAAHKTWLVATKDRARLRLVAEFTHAALEETRMSLSGTP